MLSIMTQLYSEFTFIFLLLFWTDKLQLYIEKITIGRLCFISRILIDYFEKEKKSNSHFIICESVLKENVKAGFEKFGASASFEKDAFVDFIFWRFFQGDIFFPELIRARSGIVKERRRVRVRVILHKVEKVVN